MRERERERAYLVPTRACVSVQKEIDEACEKLREKLLKKQKVGGFPYASMCSHTMYVPWCIDVFLCHTHTHTHARTHTHTFTPNALAHSHPHTLPHTSTPTPTPTHAPLHWHAVSPQLGQNIHTLTHSLPHPLSHTHTHTHTHTHVCPDTPFHLEWKAIVITEERGEVCVREYGSV